VNELDEEPKGDIPIREPKGHIPIRGGCLENLRRIRFLILEPLTCEIRHASISPGVGPSVMLSRDQPREGEGVPGRQPWTARTTTPVLRPHRASDHGKAPRSPILRRLIEMSRMSLT